MPSNAISDEPEVLLCKFCGEPALGIEGIARHLAEVEGDEDELHPENPNPQLSGIHIPQNPEYLSRIGADSLFDEDADTAVAAFRREYEDAQVSPEHKFVRLSELEALYDEMLQKQDSAGWISATKRLEEFIENHR